MKNFAIFPSDCNVMGYFNANGASVAEYDYGPFGEPIKAVGPKANEFTFRFSTKYTDPETGQIYYGYRDYDPPTGKWTSRDPIEEQGGLNLYGFVDNESVNFIDDLGNKKIGSNNQGAKDTGGAVVDAISEIAGGTNRLMLEGLKQLARQQCAEQQERRGDGCYCCHYWVYKVTFHSVFLPSSTYYKGGGGRVYKGNCYKVSQRIKNTNFLEPSFIQNPKKETQNRLDFYAPW